MKRVKQNWDIIHPEFSYLSDENLGDHAIRTIRNKIVSETVLAQILTQTEILTVIILIVKESINLENDVPTYINEIIKCNL